MKRFTALALLCLFVVFSGCSGDGGGEEKQNLKISLTSPGEFVSTEKKYEINIKAPASTSWTIYPSETWAKVEPSSGKGDAVCTVTLSENIGNDRSATLTVEAGSVKDTYTFTQSGPRTLTITPNDIDFNADSDPVEVLISTKSPWEITNTADASWVTFSKTSGTGGETIKVTPVPNTQRVPRGPVDVKIQSGTTIKLLNLYQDTPNKAPNAFTVVASPTNPVSYDSQIVLAWIAATDPDGDPIQYEVQFSQNQTAWETVATGLAATSYTIPEEKLVNDQYYWRVVAKDNLNATTASNVGLLKVDYGHYDNMVYVYQECTSGYAPINILFIGDGYIKSDYHANGDFNKHLETSIEGFFSVEPYKTYRKYFKVWVAVAYSKDQGVTITSDFTTGARMKKQTKDTRFGCVCAGGSSTNISVPAVPTGNGTTTSTTNPFRKYIYDELKIATEATVNTWTVLLSVNVDAWAGTCSMSTNGFSVARSAADYNLGRRMVHEGGGHGFAKLSDEYINYDYAPPTDELKNLTSYRQSAGGIWSWRANTDVTGSLDEVHWKHYFELNDYKDIVGLYEGCWEYSKGAWRPEHASIMQGSSSSEGFNAPSREAIVRRIMKLAGKTFDFNDFLANDKVDVGVRSGGYFDPTIRETPPEEEL